MGELQKNPQVCRILSFFHYFLHPEPRDVPPIIPPPQEIIAINSVRWFVPRRTHVLLIADSNYKSPVFFLPEGRGVCVFVCVCVYVCVSLGQQQTSVWLESTVRSRNNLKHALSSSSERQSPVSRIRQKQSNSSVAGKNIPKVLVRTDGVHLSDVLEKVEIENSCQTVRKRDSCQTALPNMDRNRLMATFVKSQRDS
ncbi:hypothetical protein RUM43_010067 [Polyplax serrata]|uniref:Uncharacterized protein n=1 Tax=Polyplax serrata TaxID=468196 RepID=A0AAN8PVC9_POLSC